MVRPAIPGPGFSGIAAAVRRRAAPTVPTPIDRYLIGMTLGAGHTITQRLAGAALVALILFSAYNANTRSINSVDTAAIQHTALALAATGRANLAAYDALVTSGLDMGSIRVSDGEARSSYPLLPALIAAPVYRMAVVAGAIDPERPSAARVEAIGGAVAATVVALAGAILYLTLAAWRPSSPAMVIALVAGLATPLWSSASQAMWSHGPAALLLAMGLGLVLAVPAGHRSRGTALLVAGVALALAVFCRQLLFVFPLGAAMAVWQTREPRRHVALLGAGLAAGSAAMMTANTVWLGTPLGGFVDLYAAGVSMKTHGVAGAWAGRWAEGLAGIAVSPSRGLLWFMPVAFVALVGARAAWRDAPSRYALLLPLVLFVALWAKYAVWWGGHSFGPRLATDIVVPLALLAAGGLVAWTSLPRLTQAVAVVAVAWSVTVQVVGAFHYPAGNWNGAPIDVDRAHERLWNWSDSQLIRTMQSGTYRQYRARQQLDQPIAEPEMMVEIDTDEVTP